LDLIFGIYTNLILTITVTFFGIYWFFRPKFQIPYRRRAYAYWWCSWVAWVFAWSLILIKQNWNFSKSNILILEIAILIFDNLNSICLIAVYFILTRGQDLTSKQARMQTFKIALSLATIFGAFYILFWHDSVFAYDIHKTCSLCISVFTPVLVGWAFNLRFKTSTALMVGCLYGFIQPIVYATELRALGQDVYKTFDLSLCIQVFDVNFCNRIQDLIRFEEGLKSYRPIVSMTVGLLKVVWAITCTKILSSSRASSDNLIMIEKSKPSRFIEEWWPSVALHATLLTAIYIVLLILVVQLFYIKNLLDFGATLGVVTGVFGLWQVIWNVWKTTRKF
jgi:hypothetical protein